MTNKNSKVVTYQKSLAPIKTQEPINIWLRDVKSRDKFKSYISAITNLSGW